MDRGGYYGGEEEFSRGEKELRRREEVHGSTGLLSRREKGGQDSFEGTGGQGERGKTKPRGERGRGGGTQTWRHGTTKERGEKERDWGWGYT